MNNFEEEVQYFLDLVINNINKAKDKKGGKVQTIFNGLNVSKDGKGILVYNFEKEYGYELWKKDIENFNFKQYLTKHLALYYIDKLYKYSNKEITFNEFANIPEETNPVVKKLLQQKDNIMDQLKLLRRNRNIPEVQEYINCLYTDTYASDYIKYLIDRYYYNKKHLVKPKKNGLEKTHKILLR